MNRQNLIGPTTMCNMDVALPAITNIPQTSTWGQIMKMHEGIFEVTPTFWCQKFLPLGPNYHIP